MIIKLPSCKAFIKRNTSIFIVGFLLAFLFLALTILYETRPHTAPGFIEYQDPIGTDENTEDSTRITSFNPVSDGEYAQPSITDTSEKLDFKVTYDGINFKPQNAVIKVGQTVRWVNEYYEPLMLEQRKFTYDEFNTPKELAPGESFSFTFYKTGIWNYRNKLTRHVGSITVDKN